MIHPQIGPTPRTDVMGQRASKLGDDLTAYKLMFEHAQALERELNAMQDRASKLAGENLRLAHALQQSSRKSK